MKKISTLFLILTTLCVFSVCAQAQAAQADKESFVYQALHLTENAPEFIIPQIAPNGEPIDQCNRSFETGGDRTSWFYVVYMDLRDGYVSPRLGQENIKKLKKAILDEKTLMENILKKEKQSTADFYAWWHPILKQVFLNKHPSAHEMAVTWMGLRFLNEELQNDISFSNRLPHQMARLADAEELYNKRLKNVLPQEKRAKKGALERERALMRKINKNLEQFFSR